jgi:mRNA-degrading endonuclease RelE of RelBE toxin-antitoxin system
MSFNIIVTEVFERKLKRLAKKHKSIKADLLAVIEQLALRPVSAT